MTKRCTKCGVESGQDNFNNDRTRSDGKYPWCRSCSTIHKRADHQKHRQKRKESGMRWAKAHPEQSAAIKNKYAVAHREELLSRASAKRRANPELFRQIARSKYIANREAILARGREYREANREKRRSLYALYADRNRDLINRKSRERYAADPDSHNALVKAWGEKNPEKRLSYVHARRARRLEGGGSYTAEEWRSLKITYDLRCLRCLLQEPSVQLTIDHVIPIKDGGSSSITNIQPLCMKCNRSKHVKHTDYRPDFHERMMLNASH